MEKTILTTSETAHLLGVSVRTAQMLIEGGALTSWKTPGGHRRVYREDVLALRTKNNRKGVQSARIGLVASPGQVEKLKSAVEVEGYSIDAYTEVYSAALAFGFHPPVMVVIDLTGNSKELLSFLHKLATNPELSSLKIAVVGRGKVAQALDYDSERVIFVPELEMLSETIRSVLTDSSVALPTIEGDLSFPLAPNEGERLAAVERSKLVGSAPEDVFDRLTWLARQTLNAPIALFTMLTSSRQWFKSRQGLDMKDTPRGWAFCNYTILKREIFTVGNLAKDSRFANNPAVIGAPKFRFYAGAPIIDADGFALGSLCIIDRKSRALDPEETEILRSLAYLTSEAVQSRNAKFRLREA